MPSREEILVIYQTGPDALVAWVEHLVTSHQQQVSELTQQVERQRAQLTTLAAQLVEVERRLGKDSHNSHQPPSSDGLAKRPRPRSLRQRSGKKSGGQVGHPGVTLRLVEKPDYVISHVPAACAKCGTSLATSPAGGCERRQIIEIPKPHMEVTEHQAVHKVCPTCQTNTVGQFPATVTQPIQYGPRVQAIGVYLQSYQLLSYERTVEAFWDLFQIAPSEGTLATAQQQAYVRLAPVEQAIRGALRQAAVAHVDESGIRVASHTAWVHVMSTPALTFYAHHAKRGPQAVKAIGLLLGFAGRRVHDAWATYLSLAGLCALCNAHLLRELIAVVEDTGQTWAQRLITLLLSMKAAVAAARAAGHTALPASQVTGFEAAYSRFINEGTRANPPPAPTGQRGRPKQTPARNLLDRLVKHRTAVLAFLHDFDVPFDNNQAERDLRMFKVKQKVSGCFRSPEGADYFCRLRGYISTLRKQDYSILEGLTSVFADQPYMPRLDA
jgi:transposase